MLVRLACVCGGGLRGRCVECRGDELVWRGRGPTKQQSVHAPLSGHGPHQCQQPTWPPLMPLERLLPMGTSLQGVSASLSSRTSTASFLESNDSLVGRLSSAAGVSNVAVAGVWNVGLVGV